VAALTRVLLVSPVASHPPDQGNAARLVAFGAALMARGITCEFLHYATEGATDAQRAAMAAFWDDAHEVAVVGRPEPRFAGHWEIDDWCPLALIERVRTLHQGRRYAAVVVSYVWLSAVLEAVDGALRVIDTHDVFGGRAELAEAEGIDPSWFFTSAAEEGRGLDRADLVLAIQDAEASVLAARTRAAVMVVGHAPPLRFLEVAPPVATVASFGYLGSGNPWNVAAVRALDAALAAAADLDWLLAGRIVERGLDLASNPARLAALPDVTAFYDAVGCVLNPMPGGTGLKVKTVEALAYGRPVLGTRAAFAGLPAVHPGHDAGNAAALVPLMREWVASEAFRAELALASRLVALRYAATVAAQFDALAAALAAGGRGTLRRPD